ncbi:3-(3-hydroxy-phenyl)propionate/3-hydroxycinnamic acid hydroxylase [Lachnellula suecica]|uniref:3-(3-hydroxy-phenyl)propionate/3-hydroxycinnamic acid hydroxylase n=1 Tax=Lachnellula suecica TaxID=602035 RepID=A0A8T9BWX1_9HELO|nr:3-(3-hydroxy-phenyl)propionate/3-hydroxycinnamic acid hydroxylase [Lachnellula suecica]
MSLPQSEIESTDVIICGCGPTGALLSAYLGLYSVKNVVLEREQEITQDPRGIALDEDGIRYLQGVGLYDKVFTEIGQSAYLSAQLTGGTSHPGVVFHKQPAMERGLREVISSQPESEVRTGSTVISIEETKDSVVVTYKVSGETKRIRGKFLVGADGKTGFTRKNYLEPKGIIMESNPKLRFDYEAVWVALNWKITPPTRETHPEFPLWKLGFTSEQVYDSFFPKHFTFICNPDRPSVCGRFGLTEDRLWRFEFVVKEGEDGLEMAKYENVHKVVYPYLTHLRNKYK